MPCDSNGPLKTSEKKFRVDGLSNAIDDIVERFSLNSAQERAFRIISNHAIGTDLEKLRMYLGGMGGTGKSQVIKALSSFFETRHEAHRFIIVAPTGTAAALLGGSTYHSMFGINDRMSPNKIGHVKAKLNGVDYVFFDEVSMLSARDLYRINAQLAKVFGISDAPFGGLNMVFCGDFAQLPPAVGGEHVSLYSSSIGAFATDKKSQEEAIGKALWHQITRVVILRQNMRQKNQSPEDASLRTALENMRYKSCTTADINFLRTRISSTLSDGNDHPSICEASFRDVSIITGTNLHKDEINRLGALRFAQETNQVLTEFYSDDSTKVHSTDADARTSNTKRVAEISDEMQKALWEQQPSSTDKQIAGKLTLCLGLPIMIRHNYATEICMTRGQEGYVMGWQSKTGSKGQRTLDTLFIELKNPPAEVHINGLPKNVVPLYPTTNSIQASLPNDERYHILRSQVEVLVNFAMTDFGSQGKTRLYNVTYLKNLSSHQAYYTALSRSATASGTLILQGFDARKITGGCSGALRVTQPETGVPRT
jgi:PIF1-like helicase